MVGTGVRTQGCQTQSDGFSHHTTLRLCIRVLAENKYHIQTGIIKSGLTKGFFIEVWARLRELTRGSTWGLEEAGSHDHL